MRGPGMGRGLGALGLVGIMGLGSPARASDPEVSLGPGLAADSGRWVSTPGSEASEVEAPSLRARQLGVPVWWQPEPTSDGAAARSSGAEVADEGATASPAATRAEPARPSSPASSSPAPASSGAAPGDAEDGDAWLMDALARLRPQARLATRINTTVQGDRRDRLDGYRFDTLLLLPRLWGSITKHIGWQLGFFARATDFAQAELRVLDVVAELRIVPELQLWAGRFVTPADRSNLSGPFLIPAWNYPGIYGGQLLIAAADGPVGRDTGAVVWGDVGEGRFKYYAAVQGLEDRSTPPRMAARANVAIIGAEPGYYNAGGYLGKRDVVTVGASAQYQPDGERLPADPEDPMSTEEVLGALWVVDVDLLAEKSLGEGGRGGTPSLEATYFAYDRFRAHRHGYFVSASYLFPWKVGPGAIQAATRWQQALPGAGGLPLWGVDVAGTYLFAGYRARLAVVYQHQSLGDGGPRWNAINIGFQFIAG